MSNVLEQLIGNRKSNPLREVSQLQESFDRLFRDLWDLKKSNGFQDFNYSPSCEVVEEGNNYLLKFDLPGVTKDQVRVESDQNQLSITAERREERQSDKKKTHMSEIYYGSYSRSFTLPGPVDEKKIDAKFENGVLTVTVPKFESTKSKQIPIH